MDPLLTVRAGAGSLFPPHSTCHVATAHWRGKGDDQGVLFWLNCAKVVLNVETCNLNHFEKTCCHGIERHHIIHAVWAVARLMLHVARFTAPPIMFVDGFPLIFLT